MPLPADKIKNETLLVSGCSFTVKDYYCGYIPHTGPDPAGAPVKNIVNSNTWTTMLGFKEVINVGDCGLGNDRIINNCIEHLIDDSKPDPDRIIIALSNWDRFDTPYAWHTPGLFMWMTPKEFERYQPGGDKEDLSLAWKREVEWYRFWGNPHGECWPKFVANTIRNVIILHELCIARKIPCHVFQLLHAWTWPQHGESLDYFGNPNKIVFDAFFNHPLANKFLNLKDIDIVGYPFERNWGGEEFWWDIYVENQIDHVKLHLSEEDRHPSPYGHTLIAKKVLEDLNYFEL